MVNDDTNELLKRAEKAELDEHYEETVRLYKKAAEKNNPVAQFELGMYFYYEENYSEAVKYFKKAAEQGDSDAQSWLGDCFYEGNGVKQDYAEAVKWYREAEKQGNSSACLSLGECYFYGNGVYMNHDKAVQYYKNAAEHGNPEGLYNLGERYLDGDGVRQNYDKAVKYYEEAAEYGFTVGLVDLGNHFFDDSTEQNFEEGFRWYKKAAELGDEEAQLIVGDCLCRGKGTKRNYEEAVQWYRKVIENGTSDEIIGFGFFAPASDRLGDCFYYGHGVKQDFKEAAQWYRNAAEQGYDYGQFDLGVCYYKGKGVEKDIDEVLYWLRQAAVQDNSEAKDLLKEILGDDYNEEDFDDDDFDFDDGDDEDEMGFDKVRYFTEFQIIPEIIERDTEYAVSEFLKNKERAADELYREAFEEISKENYPFDETDFSVEIYSRSNCKNDVLIIIAYPENFIGEMICQKGCVVCVKNEDNEWNSRYITVETDTYGNNNGKTCFLGEFKGENHINYGIVPDGKTKLVEMIENAVFGKKSL